MEMTKRKVMTGIKFLSFVLENEIYCLEIMKVKELIGLSSITHIPQTPAFIKGVTNLRGEVIPIIDLRIKFGLPFIEYNKRTSIIVVEMPYQGDLLLMGIVVDSITDVIGISEDKIKKNTYINAKIRSEFIKGIVNTEEGIKIILDITKVLTEDEFVILKGVEESNNKQKE